MTLYEIEKPYENMRRRLKVKFRRETKNFVKYENVYSWLFGENDLL